MKRTLLLVTGPGRSGTSTLAGMMHLVGAHVPGPFLNANSSNPKGFYESLWSVRFHNRLLRRANVGLADGRPEAAQHVRDAVGTKQRQALRDHLQVITAHDQLTVVKDPRATWTLDLWRSVADELGVDTAVAVMMRAPAEVVGSRATHYSAGADVLGESGFAIHNCAGWVNGMLTAELGSRTSRRAFVSYDALLDDWRGELGRMFESLGLELPSGLVTYRDHHPVDDFVDPTLSRHRLNWDDLPVPAALTTVADAVWEACAQLTSSALDQPPREIDVARARYESLYGMSRALVHDHTVAVAKAAERATRSGRPRGTVASHHPVAPGRAGIGSWLAAGLRRPRRRWSRRS